MNLRSKVDRCWLILVCCHPHALTKLDMVVTDDTVWFPMSNLTKQLEVWQLMASSQVSHMYAWRTRVHWRVLLTCRAVPSGYICPPQMVVFRCLWNPFWIFWNPFFQTEASWRQADRLLSRYMHKCRHFKHWHDSLERKKGNTKHWTISFTKCLRHLTRLQTTRYATSYSQWAWSFTGPATVQRRQTGNFPLRTERKRAPTELSNPPRCIMGGM